MLKGVIENLSNIQVLEVHSKIKKETEQQTNFLTYPSIRQFSALFLLSCVFPRSRFFYSLDFFFFFCIITDYEYVLKKKPITEVFQKPKPGY